MRRRRAIEQLAFLPDTTGPVLEWMDRLTRARDGWINLLPGVPEEELDKSRGGMFSALFGTVHPPVSMCTWMPARTAAPGAGEATVGVMHPRHGRAAAQLASMGVAVPSSWRVRQDHVRRGLIVCPLPGTPHAEVLSWTLRAGAALSVAPLTGSWRAEVYLPRRLE